jgi:hypothetical protein
MCCVKNSKISIGKICISWSINEKKNGKHSFVSNRKGRETASTVAAFLI